MPEPTAPDQEVDQDQADEQADTEQTEEAETFPREYVEQLRTENKERRVTADEATTRADQYGRRLHTALVAADGRLADPDDLTFDQAHLDDPAALQEAITALLDRKPHLAVRRPSGSIGQGETGTDGRVDLLGMLRSRVGS